MLRDRLVCIAALVAMMLVFGAVRAYSQAPGPALSRCADVPAGLNARCGSIAVPLDRANPGLGATQIAFAVLRRRDVSRPSLGTLIGPYSGGPVIDAAPEFVGTFGALLDP